ncbi:MAG: hypothetical protein ABII21_00145 [bacterium]
MVAADELSWLTGLRGKGVIDEEVMSGLLKYYGELPGEIVIGMTIEAFRLTAYLPTSQFATDAHLHWVKFQKENASEG